MDQLLYPLQLVYILIDFNLVNNRNLYSIKSHDEIKRLKNVLNINNDNEIDVYNLDNFIINKELILQQINQDNEINNINKAFLKNNNQ